MSIEEKLLDYKRKIDEAKTGEAQLKGRLATQYDRLKELGVKDEDGGTKEIKKLRAEADKLNGEVEKGLKVFEEKYGW